MSGFRQEWFMHDKMKDADRACYEACGMGLYTAWESERGCYNGNHWMSPAGIAKAIAGIVFDWEE